MAPGLVTVAVAHRRVVALFAGLGVAALGLVLPASTIAAQAEPPQRGEPVAAVWFSVGDIREVDVAAAFVGSVDSYTATSDNEAAVRASMAGSVVSLTALASGVAFVEVTATNEGGSVSQWIGVVSRAAAPASDATANNAEGQSDAAGTESSLAITLASHAYCAAERPGDVSGRDPDDADPARDRDEVVRSGVHYAVVGGRGPYVVTSPHAAADATDASGLLEIACANPDPDADGSGYRLDTYDLVAVVVEVTDAAGNTASADMTLELGLGTRRRNHGGNMRSIEPWVAAMERPEDNYVIATPTTSTLVTLVPNVDLRFVELSEDGVAHYADAGGGSEVWLDWATGAVVDSDVVVTDETYAHVFDITTVESTAAALWPWEIPPQPDDAAGEEMELGS